MRVEEAQSELRSVMRVIAGVDNCPAMGHGSRVVTAFGRLPLKHATYPQNSSSVPWMIADTITFFHNFPNIYCNWIGLHPPHPSWLYISISIRRQHLYRWLTAFRFIVQHGPLTSQLQDLNMPTLNMRNMYKHLLLMRHRFYTTATDQMTLFLARNGDSKRHQLKQSENCDHLREIANTVVLRTPPPAQTCHHLQQASQTLIHLHSLTTAYVTDFKQPSIPHFRLTNLMHCLQPSFHPTSEHQSSQQCS